MRIRELTRDEWTFFFDGFSRTHRGQPVTLEVRRGPAASVDNGGHDATLARRLPFVGITAEPHTPEPRFIEVLAGVSPNEHVAHVVRNPLRVKVAQVTNGQDEVLIIESALDAVTLVDFRSQPGALPAVDE
jgi:hypothetical protein